MRYDIPPEKIQEQIKREEAQREAALGRRFNSAQGGFLGPVISRWINSSVSPVALRLRQAAACYLRGDYHTFGKLVDTPTFGLAVCYDGGSPEYLGPILQWCLKGSSPGRTQGAPGETAQTFAEDLVLAVLGRTVSDLAMRSLVSHGKHSLEGVAGLSLAMTLSSAASTARETALGQFITMAQGATAMGAIRRPDRSSWAQRKKMSKVASVLSSQVKHALESEAKGEINLEHFGARTIVKILDPNHMGDSRRISIKAEDIGPDDWRLLGLATFPRGEDDTAKNAWISFAMIVLCCAQVEHGWFDITKAHTPKQAKSRKNTGRTRYLILAEKPRHHLKADLSKWISMGFAFDPMIIPPPDGTYLTVKTKAVTGRNGPHGWKTHGEGSTAWELAGDVMAASPWRVADRTLAEIAKGSPLTDAVHKLVPDELCRRLILGAYQKDAQHDEIYLPLYMDFRGRLYTRTSWVSYQGNDLQKGLLRFPKSSGKPDETALALHITGLLGHDKKTLSDRQQFLKDFDPREVDYSKVDDPVQLWTALNLVEHGEGDSVPIQIDGTCNGLQHLSAMFRDEKAAPWVNLCESTYEDNPADLYGEVAAVASMGVWAHSKIGEAWAMRLVASRAVIDRSVLKKPVMVLPYGGTMIAIEEGITDGIIAQPRLNAAMWTECLKGYGLVDSEAIEAGYLAFKDRPLKEHPLFRKDMQKLGQVVLAAIKSVIPRAMEAMDAFREIAGKVGDRSLEWSNAVGDNPMWIVHAYPKSERRTSIFRGFHLPNSVRGLAMKCGRDEVNPAMHRTGIVANFIHSQDAAHLVETMRHLPFTRLGGRSFGANHDCLYTRSSEASQLAVATRLAFKLRYDCDPLSSPVRLRSSGEDAKVETFESWYALAKHFGVRFPEMGRWDPSEVMKSAWFFS